MRIDCALLCDAATVREGLLHILGGGVTRINRPEFPAPAGIALALRIVLHRTEAAQPHQARFILQSEDGRPVVEGELTFSTEGGSLDALMPGEELSLPISLPFQNVSVPSAGGYSFEILIDGIHQLSVPFLATTGGG
jgi:hypothetical protein